MASASNEPDRISSSKPRGSNTKIAIAAIVVVVIIVVGYFAVAVLLKKNTGGQNVTSSAIAGGATILTNQPYNVTINTSAFTSLQVYYGDMASNTITGTNATSYTAQHTYRVPGLALIYYSEQYSNGNYYNSSNQLLPVSVTPSSGLVSYNQSLGIMDTNLTASSTTLVTNQPIFTPGSTVNITSGYYTEPVNSAYKIVSQTFTVFRNNSAVATHSIAFTWDKAVGEYTPVTATTSFNVSLQSSGMYTVFLNTTTAMITNSTTGAYSQSSSTTTSTFLDVAAFSNGKLASTSSSITGQFVIDELVAGGYSTLDPAISFDTVSLEPIYNTMLPLVGFNGSSDSNFVPMLASKLPSVANGGINNNTYSYQVTPPGGSPYTVSVQPYQNYTFYIDNSSVWQNGQAVSAWDVLYSYARVLLFDAGSPLTGGWMFGPDILPSPYTHTNTFWNITQNITVDNTTNSITFHLQKPMTPISLYGLLAFYRITSASWLAQHGAGLTWSPAGFQNYKPFGSETGYNTYVQNNIFADGPYMLKYTVPGTEIVLTANPKFHSPGAWFPKPTIGTIVIRYVSQASTIYLDMKSGAAQQGTIPSSSWTETQQLVNNNLASVLSYQSPAIFFWKYNANIDTTQLSSLSPGANLPYNLFVSENARKAFAYAFDYQYYLDSQVGNSIYHTTFGGKYAGFLETGVVFSQNYSVMQNVSQVPYFNLTIAKNYWNAFMNSEASLAGVTASGGVDMYNGKALNIPIFVNAADPVMIEGATTWAQNLAKVIPGANIPIVPLPFSEIIGLSAIRGSNPLPLFEWSLAPAYAYPTDSVGGSEMPTNTSHLGGVDITPYWFNDSVGNSLANSTQAGQLSRLLQWYGNATSTPNTAVAENYFHMINELFVNMTFYVFTEQIYQYHIVSTSINTNVYVPYEQNGLLGNDMLFNFLSYK